MGSLLSDPLVLSRGRVVLKTARRRRRVSLIKTSGFLILIGMALFGPVVSFASFSVPNVIMTLCHVSSGRRSLRAGIIRLRNCALPQEAVEPEAWAPPRRPFTLSRAFTMSHSAPLTDTSGPVSLA
jgi:hypothetical protein